MAPKKARDRKRQTKISFSPTAKSSPTTMGATPSKSATSTPPHASKATSPRPAKSRSCKASQKTVVDSSSEDELADGMRRGMSLGIPVTSTVHGMFGSSDVDAATSDTSEEDGEEEGYARAKLASRKRHNSSSELEHAKGKVIVIQAKRRRRSTLEGEASEDDELRLPPSKRRKTTRRQSTPETEEETNSPRNRRDASRRQRSLEVLDESSPPRSKRRRIARRPTTQTDNEESNEEKEEAKNGTKDDNDEERDDLQEDLAFLRSSPLLDRGKLRSTHEKPKNERQKALEALKKRRSGANEPSSSATPGRSRRIVVDSDSDSELEIIKEEHESDLENIPDLKSDTEDEEEQESDRNANALDMFLEDNEDQNFIDDDPDAIIGEPILGPDDFMPLVLQRLASAKPKDLFKHAIEWMVMKKIHPGFDSNSQVYVITFRKLDDEVKGLANSKFSSSAWTGDFTRALRARPDLMIIGISKIKKDIMDSHCEACNRKNHPASDELMFTGQPYDKETLEPLGNDSDSDSNIENSDSDSDNDSELSADSEANLNGEKPTYDGHGIQIPPESKSFTLGSTCKANAQVAHTLNHWRYHLYSWVKDYLARAGYLTAEKLVKRDGWSDKKREKAALKIVKEMEEVGEIRKLYHLYKDQVAYAVEVRHDQNRGWKGRG